jgi:hypothetical protein
MNGNGWEIRPLGELVIAVIIGLAIYFIAKRIRHKPDK